MGRRVLKIPDTFLPVLIGEGVHHYRVGKDALPADCSILDAKMEWDGRGRHLALLLESEGWEDVKEGSSYPSIHPTMTRHFCPGKDA